MEYNFSKIEKKWQELWKSKKTFKTEINNEMPKYYVLDMFPYPSGAGLHVGHPLGYIASDIYSRYKRLKGFNVLHPMGYDAFGLPAEQYAIQTGQHPAITTSQNIKKYRKQLDRIGFSYDWDREVRTCDPEYYKWTQWVFIQLFQHWFNNKTRKAEKITELIAEFEKSGNTIIDAACTITDIFSASDWNNKSENEQGKILLNYRLAYLADTMVNWCPKLGTVLANDEVKEGTSIRGDYPVEQKKMKQWSIRITAYATRLLEGIEKIDWTDSLKEIQKNWIGMSEGASMNFKIVGSNTIIEVFTTRPDTIYGATFMVLAPESELVKKLTTNNQKPEVEKYIIKTKKRTERERISEVKIISGVFSGSYAINPFTEEKIPIWISDYVLAGYGTGAIMAVPAHDSRDYAFAKQFGLNIVQVVSGGDISTESFDAKEGKMMNSGLLNGLEVNEAIKKAIDETEKRKIGKKQINYRLRDAIFSRQRYWGEPFPIFFKDGLPHPIDIDDLPLKLPDVDAYLPTEKGEPPLGRAKDWNYNNFPIEMSTMPGFAGSSAYYLRYMDPKNSEQLVSKEANNYWQDVDLYIGGTEHATGHLIYSRFWNKFLFDIGIVCKEEPFKKLINQGMIQGRSNFIYRIKNSNKYVSKNLIDNYDVTPIHVDVSIVKNDVLNIKALRKWRPEFNDAEFILENNKYICGYSIEKMSKSLYNVVNPDSIIEAYGADTLRLYEMFLGPLDQPKPWDTNGIDGVHKFLRKFWKLFHNNENFLCISDEKPNDKELKILHKTIKKISDDIERFSFNTSVSAFMICLNSLIEENCNKREILSELLILLSPFAPHICEELWEKIGNKESICFSKFPEFDSKYLEESAFMYPVSFNGKMRFKINLSLDLSNKEIEKAVLSDNNTERWLQGKLPKKIIIVPKKIINIVI
ncbi:leucine--tRNA ligase [Bacteroidota bacterium]